MMLVALLLVLHFGLAAALVAGLDGLALIPWRRARDAHWTERARLVWPVRKMSALLFFAVPAWLGAIQFLFFPEIPRSYLFTALAGLVGAAVGAWPMARALFPGISLLRWLRDLTAAIVLRLVIPGVLLAAALGMPSKPGWEAIPIFLGAVALIFWVLYGGLLWLLWAVGSLLPPPARLTEIVREVAGRMELPLPAVWQLRTYGANAYAYGFIHTLLVTEGALNALSDEELGAVCAHEFAHLSESRGVRKARAVSAFVLLPAIFWKPLMEMWGGFGCFAMGILVFLCSRAATAFRHRMEKSADSVATVHEGTSPGTYARALERLYEVNHVPAVLAGKLSHPNLYDRLVLAGVIPAYPRPAAPGFSWAYGLALLLLAVAAFAVTLQMEQ